MSDKDKHRHRITNTVAILFLLLALYILSTGPVIKAQIYHARLHGGDPWVGRLYDPIDWLADHSEVFHRFMSWYVGEIWNPANLPKQDSTQ